MIHIQPPLFRVTPELPGFFLLAGIVLVSIDPVPVLAQPEGNQETTPALQEIIVSASRIPLQSQRVSSAVTVLDFATLQRYGNQSLVDILRQQPAISLSRNGGMGQTASLRIRGEEGFRTLTLIDGIRLSDPSSTQVAVLPEHLLTQGVNRVELLRGPQGLGYGADAGGVLTISTALPVQGWKSALDLQTGRFDSTVLAGETGFKGKHGGASLQITDVHSAGYNMRESDVVDQDDDGYDNLTAHLLTQWQLSDQLQLEVVHRQQHADTQYDGCYFASTADCSSTYSMQASRIGLRHSGTLLKQQISVAHTDNKRDFFTLGQPGFSSEGVLKRLEYLGSTERLPAMTLVFGADYEEAEYQPVNRKNTGVFVEYISNFSDALTLNAGLRHDSNSANGSNNSLRFGAAWQLFAGAAGTFRFKAAYGSGFRAPSPYESSYNAGEYAYAPASTTTLALEDSEGVEGGIQWQPNAAISLEATYFRQVVNNAIYFDLNGFSGYLQETGTSVSRGVELSSQFILGAGFFLTGNYTWNPTRNSEGLARLRRPESMANMSLGWTDSQQKFRANAALRVVRDSEDEQFGVRILLDDFAVLDLNVNYQIQPDITLYARLENAMNAHYQEVAGYYTPGAALYAGVRWMLASP